MPSTTASVEAQIIAAVERSTRHGVRTRTAFEEHLRRAADDHGSGTLALPSFTACLRRLVPSITAATARLIFEDHAKTLPGIPPQRVIDVRAFAATLFPSTGARSDAINAPAPMTLPAAPPPAPLQAWELPVPAPTPPASRIDSGQRVTASTPDVLADASKELLWALGREVAARGAAGTLRRAERLTMHARQAEAAEAQLALLRLIRSIEPRASTLRDPSQLADALRPLRRHFANGVRLPAFLNTGFAPAVWRRPGHGGDVQRLLDLMCPVPLSTSSAAAKPPTLDPRAPIPPPSARAASATPVAGGRESASRLDRADGPSLFHGPFDRGDGKPGTKRAGARHVAALPADQIPSMVKYSRCRTPLLVPADFQGGQLTRSALRPAMRLERRLVHGYNGLGKHNRSPNLFTLADGRLLFCTAALAILEDTATGVQHYYDGHDDDIVCVALHPSGELAATGQGASAGGAAAMIHVWEVASRRQVRISTTRVARHRPPACVRPPTPCYTVHTVLHRATPCYTVLHRATPCYTVRTCSDRCVLSAACWTSASTTA